MRAQVTEIYKCLDSSGRPLYTSDKKDTAGKKCELVSREVNVVPTQKPAAKAPGGTRSESPAGFPKESAGERANRSATSREILEGELAKEQELHGQAKKELAAQESVRTGDERNFQRVLDRLQKYKDNVELHEKNIEALKRELSRLGR